MSLSKGFALRARNDGGGHDNRRGVTLVELLVAVSIFTAVMTLVVISLVQVFRSFHQGERFMDSAQKQRMCLTRMGRHAASIARIGPRNGRVGFKGNETAVFMVYADDNGLAEERYVCVPAAGVMERYHQQETDYQDVTCQTKDNCLQGVVECSFSYSNGTAWLGSWNAQSSVSAAGRQELPRALKLRFRLNDDRESQEFIVNIPVGP